MDARTDLATSGFFFSLPTDLQNLLHQDYLSLTERVTFGLTSKQHYEFFRNNFASSHCTDIAKVLKKRGLNLDPEIFVFSELTREEISWLLWLSAYPYMFDEERNSLAFKFGFLQDTIKKSNHLTFWRLIMFCYFAKHNINIMTPKAYQVLVCDHNLDYFRKLFEKHSSIIQCSKASREKLFTEPELKEIANMLGSFCQELIPSPSPTREQLLLDLGTLSLDETVIKTLHKFYQRNFRAAKWIEGMLRTLPTTEAEFLKKYLTEDGENTEQLVRNVFVLHHFSLKPNEETGSENGVSASVLLAIKNALIETSKNHHVLMLLEYVIKRTHEKNFLFLANQLQHEPKFAALLCLLLKLVENSYWPTFQFNRTTSDKLLTIKEAALLEIEARNKIDTSQPTGHLAIHVAKRSEELANALNINSNIWTLPPSLRSALLHACISLEEDKFGNLDPFLLLKITENENAIADILALGEPIDQITTIALVELVQTYHTKATTLSAIK